MMSTLKKVTWLSILLFTSLLWFMGCPKNKTNKSQEQENTEIEEEEMEEVEEEEEPDTIAINNFGTYIT